MSKKEISFSICSDCGSTETNGKSCKSCRGESVGYGYVERKYVMYEGVKDGEFQEAIPLTKAKFEEE